MEEKDYTVPEVEGSKGLWFWVCGNCHGFIKWGTKKCPYCKRRIIWNE